MGHSIYLLISLESGILGTLSNSFSHPLEYYWEFEMRTYENSKVGLIILQKLDKIFSILEQAIYEAL